MFEGSSGNIAFAVSLALVAVALILSVAVLDGERKASKARERGRLREDELVSFTRRSTERGKITMLVVVLGFTVLILFYLRGGIEDAKTVWMLIGPLMGGIVGYWAR